MNVNLTPQLEAWVQQKVAAGRYNNASEVVREALRLLEERDQEREARLLGLRHAIQEGLDSGPAEPWEGAETIKQKARVSRAARSKPSMREA
jgi:antitoxin ParD1/3/4